MKKTKDQLIKKIRKDLKELETILEKDIEDSYTVCAHMPMPTMSGIFTTGDTVIEVTGTSERTNILQKATDFRQFLKTL